MLKPIIVTLISFMIINVTGCSPSNSNNKNSNHLDKKNPSIEVIPVAKDSELLVAKITNITPSDNLVLGGCEDKNVILKKSSDSRLIGVEVSSLSGDTLKCSVYFSGSHVLSNNVIFDKNNMMDKHVKTFLNDNGNKGSEIVGDIVFEKDETSKNIYSEIYSSDSYKLDFSIKTPGSESKSGNIYVSLDKKYANGEIIPKDCGSNTQNGKCTYTLNAPKNRIDNKNDIINYGSEQNTSDLGSKNVTYMVKDTQEKPSLVIGDIEYHTFQSDFIKIPVKLNNVAGSVSDLDCKIVTTITQEDVGDGSVIEKACNEPGKELFIKPSDKNHFFINTEFDNKIANDDPSQKKILKIIPKVENVNNISPLEIDYSTDILNKYVKEKIIVYSVENNTQFTKFEDAEIIMPIKGSKVFKISLFNESSKNLVEYSASNDNNKVVYTPDDLKILKVFIEPKAYASLATTIDAVTGLENATICKDFSQDSNKNASECFAQINTNANNPVTGNNIKVQIVKDNGKEILVLPIEARNSN